MPATIRLQWEQLAARIDALTLRERALVGLAILAVLVAVWNLAFSEPMAKAHQLLQQQLQQAQTRSMALSSAAAALSARANIDPDREVRARMLQLQAQLEVLRTRQDKLAAAFIAPNAMAGLLREVLSHHHSLRLLSLRTAPARPLVELQENQAQVGQGKDSEESPTIYRHEMTLEIEGKYFDVLNYLRALEPQALFWDSVDYEVQAYPLARVRLKVYTLSFDKEWLSA